MSPVWLNSRNPYHAKQTGRDDESGGTRYDCRSPAIHAATRLAGSPNRALARARCRRAAFFTQPRENIDGEHGIPGRRADCDRELSPFETSTREISGI